MCTERADPKHHKSRGGDTSHTTCDAHAGVAQKHPGPLHSPPPSDVYTETHDSQDTGAGRPSLRRRRATFSTPTQSPDTHALRKTHITPLMAIHAIQAGA